jgi:hypothetical protein
VVRDADAFLGVEVPELRWWQFGSAEAKRIRVPVLSLVGEGSDAAFLEFEELLSGLLPRLETARVPGCKPSAVPETTAASRGEPGAVPREAPVALNRGNNPSHALTDAAWPIWQQAGARLHAPYLVHLPGIVTCV